MPDSGSNPIGKKLCNRRRFFDKALGFNQGLFSSVLLYLCPTMKFKLVLLAAAVLTFAASCKEEEPVPPTKTELLTAGPWIGSALTANPGIDPFGSGTPITDLWNSVLISACSKDDFTVYKTDGTYVIDDGATKCDPADPQTTTGTWKFATNETQMILDSSSTPYNIMKLDASTLEYQLFEPFLQTTLTVTYIRK